MLVASRFYRYFAGNVNTEATERTPLIQPVIAHGNTTAKNDDASRSTESIQPDSSNSNSNATAMPSYTEEEADTPQYTYFPEASDASSSTTDAPAKYHVFGNTTKEILGLPKNAVHTTAIRTYFRTEGGRDEHPLKKVHDRYRELDTATRALKMSEALRSLPMEMKRVPGIEPKTMEVGLVWDTEPSTEFLDQIHKDMLAIKAEFPDPENEAEYPAPFKEIARHLLDALPSLHKEIFPQRMTEHPAFELAVDCFAQNPDEWVDILLKKNENWLANIASHVSYYGDSESGGTQPRSVSSRLYAILNGESHDGKALTGDKGLQAHFALLDAAVKNWKGSGWRTPEQVHVLYDKVRDRTKALEQTAAIDRHWSNMFHVWAGMVEHTGDVKKAREHVIKHGGPHWEQEILQPLGLDIRKLVDSALATQSVNLALNIARTCVERLSTQSQQLMPAAQQLFLKIAYACASQARIGNGHDTDVDHQLLVELKSSVELLFFRPESSREKARSEIISSLNRLAYWCLYYSLKKENWKAVDLLKQNGIDFSIHTSEVITTEFFSALKENKLDVIRKMIELKVDVNATGGYSGKTALHKVRSVEAIELLHEAGANFLACNDDGNLPSAVAKDDAVRKRLIELENATPGQ